MHCQTENQFEQLCHCKHSLVFSFNNYNSIQPTVGVHIPSESGEGVREKRDVQNIHHQGYFLTFMPQSFSSELLTNISYIAV